MRLPAPRLLVCAAVLAICPVANEAAGAARGPASLASASVPDTCHGLPATITGTDGNDQLRGTPGDDVIVGRAGNDVIWGEGGNDVVCGGPGNDTLFGGAGDDTMFGGDGNDVLHGAEGDDTLDGGAGKNNVLQGGDGFDICTNGKPHHCEGAGGNRAPIANAGPDQTVAPGSVVSLDGSTSSDPDGDPLTFLWSFVSAPAGSNPVLLDPTAVRPSFIANGFGEYVVRLVVNDGRTDSAPDTVVIATGNSAPVANAGLDQTAPVGTLVTLDGSASTDADGNSLTFSWSILSAPVGSSAALSDSAAVHPTLLIDAPGTYVVELIVNDGLAPSEPDAVEISTVNSPPIARAGADQTARVGDTVGLDGSASSDVDGNPLTFHWSLTSVPPGSTASIELPSAVNPSFTIDQFGTYIAQLIVNDGAVDSDPDFVVINTENSAPTAHAGADQSAFVGDTVMLDGNLSSDVDGNPLTFAWALVTVPAGSTAVIAEPASATPTFNVDVFGTYVAQLIVHDGTVQSEPDTVTVTTLNSAPVANAGPDQGVYVGSTVTLDGTASHDADANPLTYRWSFTSRPPGSNAALSDSSAPAPVFTADIRGSYVAQLIVNDGTVDSAPDTVVISTENRAPVADAGPDLAAFVGESLSLSCAASTDPDGDPYTCAWTLIGAPDGSTAALSDPSSPTPAFTPDVRGAYEFALVVTDDLGVASAGDHVVVTTQNRAPVADAGADQTPFIGQLVSLSCLASTDPDGDPLTCLWTLVSAPAGSTAALSDGSSATPTFAPDVRGVYELALIVTDDLGLASTADSVLVSTVNRSPVANAGADQATLIREMVTLSCAASTDPDGDPYSCQWTLVSAPAGSMAALSDAGSKTPAFTPDVRGVYEFALVATDDLGAASDIDTVLVATINRAPIADAGADQSADVATSVTLNGGGSIDPDLDPLTFQWSITTAPDASTAALVNPMSAAPSFTPDVAGLYVFTLIASDGLLQDGDTVTLTALPPRIRLTLVGTPFLGVGRVAQAKVELPVPAPAGGVTVTVTSDDIAILEPVLPGTVFIEEGQATGLVSVLGVAPGEALLHAAAPGFDEGTATMTVTDKVVDLPPSFSVPLGQQAALTVSIGPDPAPAGGVTIQLTTSDENIIAVSATVTILAGEFSANALVTGVRPGTAIVTATNPDFATDSTPVSTAVQLNIVQGSVSFSAGLIPPDITIQLQTSGVVVPAPAPGVEVTFTSTNPDCATAPPFSLATGLSTASVTVAYGGTTTLPCTTTLTASSPGVTSDTVTVTVNPKLGITFNGLPTTVGAGMHSTGTRWVRLAAATHGGTTVRIESANPALVLVSPNATTVGTPFIEVELPNGSRDVIFVAHALEGVTGTAGINVSADKFNSASTTVTVVQPAARLNSLPTAMTVFQTPDAFNVQIGVPTANGANLAEVQNIRPGGVPVSIVVTTSAPAVAAFVSGTTTTDSITMQIDPGQSITPNVTLKPLSAGSTTVTVATPAGYTTVAVATVAVAVAGPGMTFSGMPTTVGAGMNSTGTRWVRLGATNHGGVRVRVESKQPSLVLVSRTATTVGQPFIEVDLADGQRDVIFVSHGLEGVTGTATIEVTAAGFTTANTSVVVAQPAARLNGVPAGLTVFQTPDAFSVQIGIPTATSSNLAEVQNIRPGGVPLNIVVTSSAPAVAGFVSGATTTDSVTLPINPGQSITSNVSLKPLTSGNTTVSIVQPPGYTTVATAAVAVTVSGPGMTFSGMPTTVGAGMNSTGTRWVRLGATNHGGVRVRVESKHPSLVLVSRDAATVGQPFIEVDLADGQRDVIFVSHGLEGVAGTATLEVTAPGFNTTTTSVAVVQPAARLNSVPTSLTVFTTPDTFNVQIGIPTTNGSDLAEIQNLRPGGTAVNVTVGTSQPSVASFVSGATTVNTLMLTFNPGQSTITGLLLKPHAEGNSAISVVPPAGYASVAAGTVNLTVSTPGITFSGFPTTVGAGLQSTGTRWMRLAATNHGGIRVRIESSNPLLALVSPNSTTVGTPFIEVDLDDGERDVVFTVHGMEGVSGNVVITVSAPGFSDANTTVSIQPAAIRMSGLQTTAVAGGAVDAFLVQVGLANATGSDLAGLQNVRPGGTGLSITVTSSDPAAGTIVAGIEEGGSVTIQIPAGQSQAALSFRPLAVGTTQVSAAATDGTVIETTAATVVVTVQ